MTPQAVQQFYDAQFEAWPGLRLPYVALGATERRVVDVDGFPVTLQHNPARMRSTAADVEAAKKGGRPCFLCEHNRPPQQIVGDSLPAWQILVNPYPIFPVHLTVVSTDHRPQVFPAEAMLQMALAIPGLAFFFNGASAGASAPDHLHFQAVLAEEIPLLRQLEQLHTAPGSVSSNTLNFKLHTSRSELNTLNLKLHTSRSELNTLNFKLHTSRSVSFPFTFVSFLFDGSEESARLMLALERRAGDLSNVFIWLDSAGRLRALLFPRKAHRPACYASGELLVSPGAIDMAGIVILPREEDFRKITAEQLRQIYHEVSDDAATDY